MPRGYRHIKEYEKEILELKEQGKTLREIGERLGFSRKQVHDFITRYNEQQRKIAAGIAVFISRSRAGRTCIQVVFQRLIQSISPRLFLHRA